MWDVVVLVVQLVCLAALVAGGTLSLWFSRVAYGPLPAKAVVKPIVEAQTIGEAKAAVATQPVLKRAA